jgi:hypothetical protein
MKSILSERNFAGVLFVLVLVAFSFAHEDSKKRDVFYNTSIRHLPPVITSGPAAPSTHVAILTVEKFHP